MDWPAEADTPPQQIMRLHDKCHLCRRIEIENMEENPASDGRRLCGLSESGTGMSTLGQPFKVYDCSSNTDAVGAPVALATMAGPAKRARSQK